MMLAAFARSFGAETAGINAMPAGEVELEGTERFDTHHSPQPTMTFLIVNPVSFEGASLAISVYPV